MASPVAVRDARSAKDALRARFVSRPWFRGVGIAPGDGGFVLRLSVDPTAELGEDELPRHFGGLPVEIVYIARYQAR